MVVLDGKQSWKVKLKSKYNTIYFERITQTGVVSGKWWGGGPARRSGVVMVVVVGVHESSVKSENN